MATVMPGRAAKVTVVGAVIWKYRSGAIPIPGNDGTPSGEEEETLTIAFPFPASACGNVIAPPNPPTFVNVCVEAGALAAAGGVAEGTTNGAVG